MTVTRSNFANLLAPGLATVYFNEFNSYEKEWPKLVKQRDSKKSIEEDQLVVGLGIMNQKTEGASVAYEDIAQGYKTTYTHTTFAKAIRITEEMYEDDLYDVMNDMSSALARSAHQRMEVDAANILNNAFSTTTGLGADGVSLINSSHTLSVGGTQSNALSASADLDASSLQEAIQVIETAADERGLNVALTPKLLVVPPALQWTAYELLKSEFKPGTADNEENALKSKGMQFVVNHFLTDTDAWFVLASEHKLKWWNRVPMQFFRGSDFDTGDAKFRARVRYSKGFSDFRGVAGSPGV